MQGHYRFLFPQFLIFRIPETGHITSRQKYENVDSARIERRGERRETVVPYSREESGAEESSQTVPFVETQGEEEIM